MPGCSILIELDAAAHVIEICWDPMTLWVNDVALAGQRIGCD